MLQRASAVLGKLRWRTVALTLTVLSVGHFIFIDDTLRNAYSTHVGKLGAINPATIPYIPIPTSVAPFSAGDTAEDIAICLSVKDQYADLTEWLTHHYHHLSIRRFYIMDEDRKSVV